jgi:hypothetical protein
MIKCRKCKSKTRKILKRKKFRSRKNNKKSKGGWDENNTEFIAYTNKDFMKNLLIFEKKIFEDLKSYIENKFSPNFSKQANLGEVLTFVKTLKAADLVDDFNYIYPKFSIIPKDTIFYRRQKTNTFKSENTPIWLDYTGTMSLTQFSFLKDTNEEYTDEYLRETKNYFGEFLMEFKVKKNLLIIHFPSYVASYLESWIRHICIHSEDPICVDGYTLDFLEFNPNPIYKNFKSLKGYRELCILNAENLELK